MKDILSSLTFSTNGEEHFFLAFLFFFVKFGGFEVVAALRISSAMRLDVVRPQEFIKKSSMEIDGEIESEAFMRTVLCITIILTLPIGVHSCSIEEHILVHYNFVVDRLNEHGFKGPIAYEAAKFALIRQIVEDGPTRSHSTSIVGMSVGGANQEALRHLGLSLGSVNAEGVSLKKCASAEGQAYYSLHGPRANVWSAAAVAILWDKYITETFRSRFTAEEIEGWRACKQISHKIASNDATEAEIDHFRRTLIPLSKMALRKANSIYSSTAAGAIARIVDDMEPLFQLRKGM
jgi:hypothetical protein